ncbi:hypothetical protein V8E51_019036 [Hyaloscypha variabilis]
MAENPELDMQSRVGTIIGLSVGFAILSTIIVSCRIYTRVILKSIGIDDAAIIATQILAVGLSIVTCIEAHYGLGRHSWVLTQDEVIHQLKSLFGAIQLYIWSLCIVKIALLLQYRRVFNGVIIRRVSFALILFASIWNVIQSVLMSFACIPASVFIPSLTHSCLDSLTIWYIAAALNITTDFCVFILPLHAIKSLQLPFKQKLMLSAVLGLGFFTCIISIARVFTLSKVVHTNDPSWAGMDAAIWSVVEVHSAILCSSLPTLRPLIRRLMPSLLSSHRPSEYGCIRTASKSAYVMQRTFPSSSVEGLRDSDTLSKSEFAKSKTCITKCSTGGMEGLDDDDLELKETDGRVLSPGIMVKRETVVQKEIRLEK